MFSPIFLDDPELYSDLEFYSLGPKWKIKNEKHYFSSEVDVGRAYIYKLACEFELKSDMIESLLDFMWLRLIYEFYANKTNPEHLSPVINRMNSNRKDIAKIFDASGQNEFWNGKNFTVVNLNMVNITMKKTLPLLIAKWAYNMKKLSVEPSTLPIIIDEAHNILSNVSFRETESWKDYRLETFEEIIKEGRKFGV
ncbi:ATPase, partial [Escherichia coli]|nr:ATPase [Escherichia coli]